ncbi:hypothetical protein TeGR_g9625 [Tetraparma gracilis]|uniref:Uncharacterized protein n=1 Tax=Tetraparma gracilis TaxID=2962635 RepID=A0ABQ6MP26_9STRA|nr:hypothetical protein TeGR_g9625 [Tetraparma gracilis]
MLDFGNFAEVLPASPPPVRPSDDGDAIFASPEFAEKKGGFGGEWDTASFDVDPFAAAAGAAAASTPVPATAAAPPARRPSIEPPRQPTGQPAANTFSEFDSNAGSPFRPAAPPTPAPVDPFAGGADPFSVIPSQPQQQQRFQPPPQQQPQQPMGWGQQMGQPQMQQQPQQQQQQPPSAAISALHSTVNKPANQNPDPFADLSGFGAF